MFTNKIITSAQLRPAKANQSLVIKELANKSSGFRALNMDKRNHVWNEMRKHGSKEGLTKEGLEKLCGSIIADASGKMTRDDVKNLAEAYDLNQNRIAGQAAVAREAFKAEQRQQLRQKAQQRRARIEEIFAKRQKSNVSDSGSADSRCSSNEAKPFLGTRSVAGGRTARSENDVHRKTYNTGKSEYGHDYGAFKRVESGIAEIRHPMRHPVDMFRQSEESIAKAKKLIDLIEGKDKDRDISGDDAALKNDKSLVSDKGVEK